MKTRIIKQANMRFRWFSIFVLTLPVFAFGCGDNGVGESVDGAPVEYVDASPDGQQGMPLKLDGRVVGSDCLGCPLWIYENDRQMPLTEDVGIYPAWSPDGQHIAFLSPGEMGTALRIANLEGIINEEILAYGLYPAWSPDGEHIALAQGNISGSIDLILVNVSNGQISTLVENGTFPSWNPDGTKIVFSRQVSMNSMLPDYSLFIIDVATKVEEMLTSGINARWSPSGEEIAFLRVDPERSVPTGALPPLNLFVIHPDGTNEEKIYTSNQPFDALLFGLNGIHNWSSDSQQLLFTEWIEEDNNARAESHLLNLNDSTTQLIGAFINPAWYSPPE